MNSNGRRFGAETQRREVLFGWNIGKDFGGDLENGVGGLTAHIGIGVVQSNGENWQYHLRARCMPGERADEPEPDCGPWIVPGARQGRHDGFMTRGQLRKRNGRVDGNQLIFVAYAFEQRCRFR